MSDLLPLLKASTDALLPWRRSLLRGAHGVAEFIDPPTARVILGSPTASMVPAHELAPWMRAHVVTHPSDACVRAIISVVGARRVSHGAYCQEMRQAWDREKGVSSLNLTAAERFYYSFEGEFD